MNSLSADKLMRSSLYVPASNSRAIEKSLLLDSDVIIYDLEDSVAINAKQSARENLIGVFSAKEISDNQTVIRTNSIGSADYLKDLETVRKCGPTAVLLPKVSSVADLELFERDSIASGLSEHIKSWFMIETAAGIVNLADIIEAGQQCRYELKSLVVGHNDLAKETGVSLAEDRRYLVPWLMQIVLHAKSRNIEVIDSVWNNFKDIDGFSAECRQAKQMGFSGKTLIHPSQISTANVAFSPDEEEINHAKVIILAYQRPENADAGVISLNGQMIERLHLQQAEALLAKYGIEPFSAP